jgi:hypothetical protein
MLYLFVYAVGVDFFFVVMLLLRMTSVVYAVLVVFLFQHVVLCFYW